MSSRKCVTICHISLICDMPLFIYKSKPHGNGPAAMKKDTIDKLIGRIDHIKEEDLQRFLSSWRNSRVFSSRYLKPFRKA